MDGQISPSAVKVMTTPTETLIRVRNNQRRHRQRRREYIAFLERRLKDIEKRLAQAQVENAALRSKINVPETNMATHITSASRETRHYPPDARITDPGSASVASVAVLQPGFPKQEVGSESYEGTMIDDIPPFLLSPNLRELTLPRTYLTSPSAVQPRPACCSRTSPELSILNKDTSWLSDPSSVYGASVFLLTSSTTLCSPAYLIIQHHNRRQLPMEAVERWLWPGFIDSGPSAEQGCRVDNQLLLGLLEYITEWESLDL